MRITTVVLNYLVHTPKYPTTRIGFVPSNVVLYHSSESSSLEETLPFGWYKEAYPKLAKLSHLLMNFDLVDGRLINVNDNSIIRDERLLGRMNNFKALSRVFLGAPSVQDELKKNMETAMAERKCGSFVCFSKPSEREPMTVNSLTKICNVLDISAQQRKTVRLIICPQITQHRIWTGALEEVLRQLKTEMKWLNQQSRSKGIFMGQQIVSMCLKFLGETANHHDHDSSSSWMRPKPVKMANSPSSHRWEEVFEMFNDLVACLKDEQELQFHVSNLRAMREGLTQIKDVLIDRNIGYREVQHQDSLVQKKLLKTLGQPSRCLFTLLVYYLYGTIRDIEVEVSGRLYEIDGKNRFCLCMGKILTCDDERTIWNGVKQLDRALGLFKFVWEAAKMKGILELQGHLWCVGAQHRTLTYRGNVFFVHGINL